MLLISTSWVMQKVKCWLKGVEPMQTLIWSSLTRDALCYTCWLKRLLHWPFRANSRKKVWVIQTTSKKGELSEEFRQDFFLSPLLMMSGLDRHMRICVTSNWMKEYTCFGIRHPIPCPFFLVGGCYKSDWLNAPQPQPLSFILTHKLARTTMYNALLQMVQNPRLRQFFEM